MGVLKYSLYVLLPLFLMGNVTRFEIRQGIFVTPIDLGVVLLLPISIFYLTSAQKKISKNPLSKYILLFTLTLAFSLVTNIFFLSTKDILIASLYFVRFFAYLQLILIFTLFEKSFSKKYLWYLGVTVTIASVFGFVQYMLYNNLRNLEYLGWDVHHYRIFGSFLDPNFAGVIFLLGGAISYYFALTSKGRAKKASYIATVLNLAALILTYSRTAYIALVATLIVLGKNVTNRKIVALTVIALCVLLIFIPKNLTSEGVKLFRTTSIEAREEEYIQGLRVFWEHPITGVGFNAYRAYNPRAQSMYPENAANGIPNSYLLTLSTAGIIGLLGMIYFLWGVTRLIKTTKDKNLYMLLILSTTIVATSALFENTFYYNFMMFLYFCILGTVIRLRESN